VQEERDDAVERRQQEDGRLEPEVRKQHEPARQRAESAADGVRQREPAGGAGVGLDFAAQRRAGEREEHSGQQRNREHQRRRKPQDVDRLPDQLGLIGGDDGREPAVGERGDGPRQEGDGGRVPEGPRIAAQPTTGQRAAEADTREDDREDDREARAGVVDEQVQETEPHHFEREDDATREERRGEELPSGPGGARRRARGLRGAAFAVEPASDTDRGQGGSRVQARGRESPAADAEPPDQRSLPGHRTDHGAQRIPPVEASECRSEVRIAHPERLHEHGKCRAHRRGGNQQQEEADEEAQRVQEPRLG
jgi:hypothetical protein